MPEQEIKTINAPSFIVGESPLWDDRKEILYTVDFRGKCIRETDFSSGKYSETQFGRDVSALALCADGRLLIAMDNGVYYTTADGVSAPLWVPEKLCGRRLNDGKVGPDGRYYVGSKAADHEGALYRIDSDGSSTVVLNHVGSANGSAWSSDGKTFYFCDTADMELCAFDFDGTEGTLSNRRGIISVPCGIGEFDGMAVDSEDKLWCAVWGSGRIYRIDPETGKVMSEIAFPVSKVSSCSFAGKDLKTLVVTTASIRTDMDKEPLAGSTFTVRVDVPGRASYRFGCAR